jgi:hypothetical protein
MTYDFSPLFRTAIGFDRMTHLLDSAMTGAETNGGYPPYNIEKTGENAYRITMAVAGFAADDLSIVTQENALVVAGRVKAQENGAGLPAPRHRRPRLRAPVPARRLHQGERRRPRERPPARRPRPRGSRGDEAAAGAHRDQAGPDGARRQGA